MSLSGVFDKTKDNALAKRILDFYEDVRYNYLSAREDPRQYRNKWKKSVKKIRDDFDGLSGFSTEMKKYLDEDLVFNENILNPESHQAKELYSSIKNMRFNSAELNDPFAKTMGDKVIENLLEDPSIYAMFIHYALRSHAHSIKQSAWAAHDAKADEITDGAKGLDLKLEDIPLYIIEHYGDEIKVDVKRVKSKFKAALELLENVYLEANPKDAWDKLVAVDLNKSESGIEKDEDEEKTEIAFIIPNKPMYRIFEINDIKQLKGFSGEWLVQEKFDGIRIQLHKDGDTVKVFTYNKKDISKKCSKIVGELKQKKFGDMILDAELILYDNNEPLHRADTIAHLFKDKYEGAELKARVFDILNHDGKSLLDTPLRERINILFYQLSQNSADILAFPNKKNTKIADSIQEVKKYAKDIMSSRTSEGVVIKDIESTYYVGSKKNPKWIKWKKFVDLDVIVLDKSKTKSNLYSYTVGVGPLSGEEAREHDGIEHEGKTYLKVGKALNTKEDVEIGAIVRVKVDEVKRKGKGYSLYSAKVIEIPEVEAPEKLITLDLLAKDGKKSLKYNVEDALLKCTITDGIHGNAEIIMKSDYEGFTIYGFKGDDLMGKNALADIDMWKEQLDIITKTKIADARIAIKNHLQDIDPTDKGVDVKKIMEFAKKEIPKLSDDLWENNERKLRNWLNDHDEFIAIDNRTFAANRKTLIKDITEKEAQTGVFKLFIREDDNLDFIIEINDEKIAWTIDIQNTKDIYNLFGKAGKYPAEVSRGTESKKLLDKGEVEIGVQKHGYHEYRINGDKFDTRLHFRVVPVNEQDTWLVWTGYKEKMLSMKEDKGIWDIREDRHKKLTMQISE